MSTIGKNIKKLRQEKCISQDKLSSWSLFRLMLSLKLSLINVQISALETFQKLVKALGVSLDDLVNK